MADPTGCWGSLVEAAEVAIGLREALALTWDSAFSAVPDGGALWGAMDGGALWGAMDAPKAPPGVPRGANSDAISAVTSPGGNCLRFVWMNLQSRQTSDASAGT